MKKSEYAVLKSDFMNIPDVTERNSVMLTKMARNRQEYCKKTGQKMRKLEVNKVRSSIGISLSTLINAVYKDCDFEVEACSLEIAYVRIAGSNMCMAYNVDSRSAQIVDYMVHSYVMPRIFARINIFLDQKDNLRDMLRFSSQEMWDVLLEEGIEISVEKNEFNHTLQIAFISKLVQAYVQGNVDEVLKKFQIDHQCATCMDTIDMVKNVERHNDKRRERHQVFIDIQDTEVLKKFCQCITSKEFDGYRQELKIA